MKALLIPVKSVANAKQRLAPYFSPEDRAALADALWQDFFETVSRARGIERIIVISAEARVLERAMSLGWEILPERRQVSESHSVDDACRWCTNHDVNTVLRVPVDLPLVEPDDIESLFVNVPVSPGAVIVPSRDGDGTNALLRTPPTLFPSRFGPGSFALHCAAAAKSGAEIKILRNARLEFDLDDLGDLQSLNAASLRPGLTKEWLASHRLEPDRIGATMAEEDRRPSR